MVSLEYRPSMVYSIHGPFLDSLVFEITYVMGS